MLTSVNGFDRLAIQTVGNSQVADGKFTVIAERADSAQRFSLEVKAYVRGSWRTFG